jgi:hypothetical protein
VPKPIPRFVPGKLLVTEGALNALENQDILTGITRHVRGDWGNMDARDRMVNERALIVGRQLLSIFNSEKGREFYVITEADRSSTTVMMPEEWVCPCPCGHADHRHRMPNSQAGTQESLEESGLRRTA